MALGIAYHPNLYLGESIRKKKLDRIYEAKQLCQQYYNKYPPHVIGIAGSREEALQMIEQMAKECFRARGDCALKEYLRC